MSDVYQYVGKELTLFAHADRWKKYWSRMLRPYIKGRVLEVGAGIGVNIDWLWHPEVTEWICLEPDPDLADHIKIRQENNTLPENIRIVGGDLSTLQTTTNDLCDTILYLDVLEHIQDDHGEIERALASLNPQGYLIVLAPAHQQLFSPFDRHIGHYRRYNRKMLQRLAPPPARLAMLRFIDSVGLLISLGNRLILRQSLPTLKQIYFWDRCLIPLSRCLDPLLGYRLGKSCLMILQKQTVA